MRCRRHGSSPSRTRVRASAARWAREGSPIEAAATALGMPPGSLEPTLREILSAWRDVLGPQLVEPWDYRYLVGSMARRVGPHIPRESLQPINDAHLRSLGADPERLRITYDVSLPALVPRETVALTIQAPGPRPPTDAR